MHCLVGHVWVYQIVVRLPYKRLACIFHVSVKYLMYGREFEYFALKLRFWVVNTVKLIFAKLKSKKQLTF